MRAPAWGLIVLERSGATVFHPEELTIVRELARLALLQADIEAQRAVAEPSTSSEHRSV